MTLKIRFYFQRQKGKKLNKNFKFFMSSLIEKNYHEKLCINEGENAEK